MSCRLRNRQLRTRLGNIFLAMGCLCVGWVGLATNLNAQLIVETPVPLTTPSRETKKGTLVPEPGYMKILAYQNIEPTAAGLRFYLEKLQPNHPARLEQNQQAVVWIEDLSKSEYRVRQKAMRNLTRMPVPPVHLYNAAKKSKNPEVAAAAFELLRRAGNRETRDSLDGVTSAVCELIVDRQIKGLTKPLLEAIPLFSKPKVIRDLRAAVKISSIKSDVDLLTESLAAKDINVRLAAINGLVASQGAECKDILLDLLNDEEESVRLLAAFESANFGFPESIDCLLLLMNSDDLNIRTDSHRYVRALTGKNFKYYPYDDKDKRKKTLGDWKSWATENARTTTLNFPLELRRIRLGKILVSDYSSSKVVELNMKGEVTWEKTIDSPWGVQGLPNGNRLIATYNPSSIIEFNEKGEEVWKVDKIAGNVMGISRLDNGNTVAACSEIDKLIEFDREGKEVWEMEIKGRPTDVRALENGNLLVSLMNKSKIVEVNRRKEVVWEMDTVPNPLHVLVTDEGTILVTGNNGGEGKEYNRDGTEVDNPLLKGQACSAVDRTGDGITIRCNENSIRAFDRSGKELWKKEGFTYCYGLSPF